MQKDKDYIDRFIDNTKLIQVKKSVRMNENLGVTQDYENNRKIYENNYKMYQYRAEMAGVKNNKDYLNQDLKIKDSITGKNLYSNTETAKRIHKENYREYIPHVDHVISLSEGHKVLKKNPFLNDDDVRDILNCKDNYAIVNAKLNQQKQDKNILKLITDEKIEMNLHEKGKYINKSMKSSSSIAIKTGIVTTKNIKDEFMIGAINSIEAMTIPLVVEGIHNLYLVSTQEKDFDVAINDMGKLTTNIAIRGGGMQVLTTAIKGSIHTVNNIANLMELASIISTSTIRYINGEIDGEEFFIEISKDGLEIMSSCLGMIIGQAIIPIPVIGALIGSTITSIICTNICEYCRDMYNQYKAIDEIYYKLNRIKYISEQALLEINRQQSILRDIVDDHFKEWDKEIKEGYNLIYKATMSNNVEGISLGLGKILNLIGEHIRFQNYEEFDEFFMDEHAILKF